MFRPGGPVLALAAHPDDIEPQIGGTLAMWAAEGIEVLLLTVLETTLDRKEEGKRAGKALGVMYDFAKGFGTELGSFDAPGLVALIENLALYPDTIVTPSEFDSHPDHRKVADLGYQLARRNRVNLLQMSHAIPGVSGHPFPNLLVALTDAAAWLKMEAVSCYSFRLDDYKTEIQARDAYYASLLGVPHAEGMTIVKAVNL